MVLLQPSVALVRILLPIDADTIRVTAETTTDTSSEEWLWLLAVEPSTSVLPLLLCLLEQFTVNDCWKLDWYPLLFDALRCDVLRLSPEVVLSDVCGVREDA